MRVKLGLCVVALLTVTLVACGGGSSSGGGGGNGNPTLQSITISPSTPTISAGSTQPFTATGHYSDNSTKTLTTSASWSSSDTTVATVANTGVATGVKAGTATITATSGTISGSTGLTVNAVPPPVLNSIAVTPSNPTLFVGASQQFVATGTYSDGSQKVITGSVTWASSDANTATINPAGLASGVHGNATKITISATSGSVQGSTGLTVTALLNSISVTPTGPGILVAHTQQFAATGTFNDGTVADLTASSTWDSSNHSDATINSSGLATGVAPGAVTITAQEASADGTVVTGQTALNVVATAMAGLNGPYAFTLVGADTRGNEFYAGSFTADGSGHLTNGVEDANTGSGLNTNKALSGTYSMYPDGRGTITFAANAIHPNGITLRFILASGGATGKLVEFDGADSLKGEFKAQSPTDVLQSGKYVFLTGGADASGNKMQQIGIFKTNGSGNINSGKFDANDAGAIIVADLAATTYGAPDTNGRGTLTLSTVTPAITQNYVYYIVDSTRVNLIQVDAGPNTALGGFAELQIDLGHQYADADLDGSFAFLMEHPMLAGDPNLRGEFGIIGHLQFHGDGTVDGGIQDEHHNFRITYDGIHGSAPITGANGRGVLNEIIPQTPPPDLTETYIFYMVSTTKMVLLHTQNGKFPVPTPDAGVGEQQSPTFSDSTLSGNYALSGSELAGSNTEVLGALTFDGLGGISGIEDVSQNGTLFSKVLGDSYTTIRLDPNPDPNTGRGEVGPANDADPLTDYLIYVIDSNKAWSVGADQPDLKPDTMGSIEKQ